MALLGKNTCSPALATRSRRARQADGKIFADKIFADSRDRRDGRGYPQFVDSRDGRDGRDGRIRKKKFKKTKRIKII